MKPCWTEARRVPLAAPVGHWSRCPAASAVAPGTSLAVVQQKGSLWPWAQSDLAGLLVPYWLGKRAERGLGYLGLYNCYSSTEASGPDC